MRSLSCLLLLGAWSVFATDAVLDRGNGPEPTTLDAHRGSEVNAQNVLMDLYEGLVTFAADGTIVPGMAERWAVSADGLTWTFHLRDNLRWSNGEALTAAQYVASMRRALDPETAAPLASLFATIRHAPAVMRGDEPTSALGIHAPDARTVVIELTQPTALLERLTLPVAAPIHLPSLQRHGAQHTRPGNWVGNGPYRLVEWTPQASLLLERNPRFHAAGEVAIDRVRFHVTEDANTEQKRFVAGDLDLTEVVPPGRLDRLRARFGSQLRISPYLGTFYFGYNLRRAPFADQPKLRRALSLAVDRDILTRYITALGETPAYALIPPVMLGTAARTPPDAAMTQAARVAEAQRLYAESGYSRDAPLEIELRYNTSTPHRRLALAVAAMWREQLGVRTHLVNEEWKVFVQNRRSGRLTEVFRGGWIADVDDPLAFLDAFDGASPTNWTGYGDAAFSRSLAAARATPDPALRMQRFVDAETRLLQSQPILPIYFYVSKHLVRDEVEGFVANPLDRHPSRWMRLRAVKP
ncbi:MAG: peptide ABC transporter substrate-binding protein [Xanthomonadales bacterium]|nr:peptide ABC transporter substrate-binding protein [Xanthomonadales bacterium]MBP6079530.1 peptide ABC transporter substrate-binding protein [Xanthomonadales bacterium]MBP7623942.1 peptide ABC transporter substrate-binding protein [Xanthomonadales bacterium]